MGKQTVSEHGAVAGSRCPREPRGMNPGRDHRLFSKKRKILDTTGALPAPAYPVRAAAYAHGDGSYPRLMNQLLKRDLLILDDWGIQKITAAQRQDLMKVIEDRHGRRSTLIASQLPTEHWARLHRRRNPGRRHPRPAAPRRAPPQPAG